jgi:hypothetical protein|tara:strand:+ start:904 stop:1323 length:420 start_codon:yes stop_codon:yes gene_type:complete
MEWVGIYKIMKSILFLISFLITSSVFAEARVYFINLEDGDEVESPFLIQFGLSEMGIAPAGIDRENTGHHHLLINVKDLDFSKPIPASKNHIHFGGGQTESLVELPPGDYRLQLVLGDMTHTPHTPPVVSRQINITVKD